MARSTRGRYASIGDGDGSGKLAIDAIESERLGDMVKAVLGIGDAVLFGITRDGGSVRIILMSGDEKQSEYLASAPEVTAFCRTVKDHITNTLM
jgi:hypothetical protein